MIIGVLKETKRDENRVALMPAQVKILVERGHTVLVEPDAGLNSGFPNDEYRAAGATLTDINMIFERSALILKVKTPLESEYFLYRAHHTLFCYLHFDENLSPDKIRALIADGFLGIAYEWVTTEDGRHPLLEPMSRLTGYLFAQRAVELCTRYKGIMCGRYESFLAGSQIMLIGLGTIGCSALMFALDNKMRVVLVDKHPETIEKRLRDRFGSAAPTIDRLRIIRFDNADPLRSRKEIAEALPGTDILLNCAVRRNDLPKERLDYLVTADMVAAMRSGSVVCDTTACDNDLLETAVSSDSLHDHYQVNGVVHYNCDHLPSYVGRTATELLTSATFPYILEMADKGIHAAIRTDKTLKAGVSCFRMKITHEYTARKKGFTYTPIDQLLPER